MERTAHVHYMLHDADARFLSASTPAITLSGCAVTAVCQGGMCSHESIVTDPHGGSSRRCRRRRPRFSVRVTPHRFTAPAHPARRAWRRDRRREIGAAGQSASRSADGTFNRCNRHRMTYDQRHQSTRSTNHHMRPFPYQARGFIMFWYLAFRGARRWEPHRAAWHKHAAQGCASQKPGPPAWPMALALLWCDERPWLLKPAAPSEPLATLGSDC